MSIERFTHLLELQEDAAHDRAALLKQREAIVTQASLRGRDLNATEDAQFRHLTGRLAEIDRQIEGRDKSIEQLAPLCAIEMIDVPEDEEATRRAAAAYVFLGMRDSAPRKRGERVPSEEDEHKPPQRLTLAQARGVAALDSAI